MYIEKIDLTFYSDNCNYSNNFHSNSNSTYFKNTSIISQDKGATENMMSEFEFYPGEYLVGDMLINPNKN